jgi:hypothetical protein
MTEYCQNFQKSRAWTGPILTTTGGEIMGIINLAMKTVNMPKPLDFKILSKFDHFQNGLSGSFSAGKKINMVFD